MMSHGMLTRSYSVSYLVMVMWTLANSATAQTTPTRPADTHDHSGGASTPEHRRADGHGTGVIVYPQPQISHATDRYAAIFSEHSPIDERIEAALDSLTPATFRFDAASLVEVKHAVEDGFEIPVAFDAVALEGIDLDEPKVTENLPGLPLRSALRRILNPAGLTLCRRDDTLFITTKESAELGDHMLIAVYPLPISMSATDGQGIVDLVTSMVLPTTWDAQGGPGSIRTIDASNELVVCQTYDAHETLIGFFRLFDADLSPESLRAGATVIRIHHVPDGTTRRELAESIIGLCNSALGERGDPKARVTISGDSLVVESGSRSFHVYASEVVRSRIGVRVHGGGAMNQGDVAPGFGGSGN